MAEKINFKSAIVYGVGFSLLTTLVATTVVPEFWAIPWIGLTVGGIVYYGAGYAILTWIRGMWKPLQ